MKFWEALAEQTKKGGRIKRRDHCFSSTNENGYCFSSSPIFVDDINADDWELYSEPVKTYTFIEAVQLMNQGKFIKRLEKNISFCAKAGWMITNEDEMINISIESFLATDWIVEDKS